MPYLGNRSIWLLFVVFFALWIVSMPVVADSDPNDGSVDITNDHNRDFLEGYEYVYKEFPDGSKCSAMQAEYRSGHQAINLNYLCDGLGITEEKVYQDAMKSMAYVKKNSNARNFSEYFAGIKQNKKAEAVAATYSIEQSGADARDMWAQSCLDAKARKISRLESFVKKYNKLDKIKIKQLHLNAYAAVEGVDNLLDGDINCEKAAKMFFPDVYASERDFRADEYKTGSKKGEAVDEPQQFCLESQSNGYMFTNIKSADKPDWKYIYSAWFRSYGGTNGAVIGLWQVNKSGAVIAKTLTNTFEVDMRSAYQCGSVPYAPKPYN